VLPNNYIRVLEIINSKQHHLLIIKLEWLTSVVNSNSYFEKRSTLIKEHLNQLICRLHFQEIWKYNSSMYQCRSSSTSPLTHTSFINYNIEHKRITLSNVTHARFLRICLYITFRYPCYRRQQRKVTVPPSSHQISSVSSKHKKPCRR